MCAIEIPELLKLDGDKLGQFCRDNRIVRLSIFGSAVGEGLRPDSDIDVLVDFEEPVGFFELCRIEEEMAGALFGGRKVDLVTRGALCRHIRESVLEAARTVYEREPGRTVPAAHP